MIDDLAMNAYLRGYIAALRNRHRPQDRSLPENPYDDPSERAGWLEGFRDAIEEFGELPARPTATLSVSAKANLAGRI